MVRLPKPFVPLRKPPDKAEKSMEDTPTRTSPWDRLVQGVFDGDSRKSEPKNPLECAALISNGVLDEYEAQAPAQRMRRPTQETAALETLIETATADSLLGPALTGTTSSSESQEYPTSPISSHSTTSSASVSTASQDSLRGSNRWTKRMSFRRSWISNAPITTGAEGVDLSAINSDKFFATTNEESSQAAFWSDKGVAVSSFAGLHGPPDIINITGLAKDRPLLAISDSHVAAVVGSCEVLNKCVLKSSENRQRNHKKGIKGLYIKL